MEVVKPMVFKRVSESFFSRFKKTMENTFPGMI